MKKYESYKDSGIEWIGKIPSYWNVKKLKFISKICNGQDQKAVLDDEGIYPIYGSGGIFGKANSFLFDKPSVLLGRKGTIDKPQYVEEPFWTVDTSYYTRIYSGFSVRLFYYLCTTINFDLYKYGSAVPSMTQGHLNEIKFAIPKSYEEQLVLANYLDHKTTQIDDLIAKKERLIQLLEEERIAVINQAVIKGLNPNVPMKDSGIEWLGEIPEHWEVKRLRNIVDIVKTGSTPPSEEIQYFEPQDINWYGPGDFENLILGDSKRKISNLAIEENKCRLFPSNSILLIGIGATVGKVGLAMKASSSNQQINAIILKENYNVKFYLYFLSTIKEIIVMEASSATLPIFNQTQTKNIVTCVPPIEEQTTITNYLDHKTTQIHDLIAKAQQEMELLKEYKRSLISEVVTGKVDVRNEKLNWDE